MKYTYSSERHWSGYRNTQLELYGIWKCRIKEDWYLEKKSKTIYRLLFNRIELWL